MAQKMAEYLDLYDKRTGGRVVDCSGLENQRQDSSETLEKPDFCGPEDARHAMFPTRSAGRNGTKVGTHYPRNSVTRDKAFEEAVERGEVSGVVGGAEYSIWRARRACQPTGRLPDARLQMNDDGLVYFLQAGEDGPIKIGTTTNLKRRLNKLQQGHAERLIVRALRTGGRKTERRYHDRYVEFHIRGEWFHPAPAILSEIERLKGNV